MTEKRHTAALATAGNGRREGSLKILYFAYGANMHPEQIKMRCLGPEMLSVARLADYRLAFFGTSLVWDGGLETIVPSPGKEVWGVLYALFPLDADSLDAWQDARFDGTGAYFHSPVTVTDSAGVSHEALLYKKDLLGEPRKPSREYLEHIARGAELRGLPEQYVTRLRDIPTKKARYPVPVMRQDAVGQLRSTTCADCGSLIATD
jgi:hypothetical protein